MDEGTLMLGVSLVKPERGRERGRWEEIDIFLWGHSPRPILHVDPNSLTGLTTTGAAVRKETNSCIILKWACGFVIRFCFSKGQAKDVIHLDDVCPNYLKFNFK